ncbi:MAG TPA: PucR family transcriptional regulator, partial [Firmicutes bacterium]|nr:PucR family transcriptional regulator [Bacillota bacterium]
PVASHNGIRRISSADREARLVCPIRTGRRHGGWIVVWERRAVLDNWGLTAIQHAATVAALEVEKLQALRNLERTMRDDFLHHLVRGDFQTENSARERAWKLGWDMAEAYAAICFRLVSTPAAWTDEKTARAAWEVVDLLSGGGVPPGTMVGVDHAERPLVLYPVRADVPTERADDSVAGEVKRLLGSLKRLQPKLELLAGIGRPRKGVRGIGETYQEAVLALELAPAVPGIGPVIRFRDLGIHRLTRDVSASEVTEFVRDVLGPLLDFDRKHSTELMVTLRAFLEHGGNYREAARELYLHHSTVRYRLQQVEKLCGVNLSSARDRFNLQLALALMLANNFSS